MQSLFQKFDVDGSHKLTSTTLRDAFTKLGHEMTSEELEEILHEHDIDHHKELTFDEFKAMILDHM